MDCPDCRNIFKKYYRQYYFKELPLAHYTFPYDMVRSILRNETMNFAMKAYRYLPPQNVLSGQIQHIINTRKTPNRIFNAISRRYNYPPYALLNKMKVDISQKYIEEIGRMDAYTGPPSHKRSLEQSKSFENDVSQILLSKKIQFKTEAQLREENYPSTPDFWIPKQNLWIDAKNMYACPNSFTKIIIRKQTKKYTNDFGPNGLFVFRYGVDSSLQKECPNEVKLVSFADFSESDLKPKT